MSPAASVSGVILALARASQPRLFPRFVFNVAESPARDEGTSALESWRLSANDATGCVASLSTGTPAITTHGLLGSDAARSPMAREGTARR